MEKVLAGISVVSKVANWIAGILLVVMVLLTMTDVVLRGLGTGITGTYELMSFAGALVVGFSIAKTSLDGAHVNVDMLTQIMGKRTSNIMLICTKIVGLMLFILLAWSFFVKGNELRAGGETSLTLRIPFHPVAYALLLCSFVECLVLFADIVRAVVPKYSIVETSHE